MANVTSCRQLEELGKEEGAEPKAAGPHVPGGPCARRRRGVCLFPSLPRPPPGTLADRDGVFAVSVRWFHAAPSADMEPITAVGMRRRAMTIPRRIVSARRKR